MGPGMRPVVEFWKVSALEYFLGRPLQMGLSRRLCLQHLLHPGLARVPRASLSGKNKSQKPITKQNLRSLSETKISGEILKHECLGTFTIGKHCTEDFSEVQRHASFRDDRHRGKVRRCLPEILKRQCPGRFTI